MEKTSEKWSQSPYLCEVKLSYNPTFDVNTLPVLDSPSATVRYLREIWNMNTIDLHEDFYLLLFNHSLQCLGWHKVSSGGKAATVVDISKVVSLALLGNACSITIAHNHPSGGLKESKADIRITRRISDALQLLGIQLNDHIILTRSSYCSFFERGLLSDSVAYG